MCDMGALYKINPNSLFPICDCLKFFPFVCSPSRYEWNNLNGFCSTFIFNTRDMKILSV